MANIFYGFSGQLRGRARAARTAVPSGQAFIDRLDPRLQGRASRQAANNFPVQAIARADFDFLQSVQNVQLGQGDACNAARDNGLAHHDGVKPSAAALTACYRPKLMAAFAETLADFIGQFRRKGAFADTGCIGFGDTQHIVQRAGPQACSAGGLPGNRVGTRDKGIRAVINVEHGALGAFKEDALLRLRRIIQHLPNGSHERQDLRSHIQQALRELIRINGWVAETFAQRIVVMQQVFDAGL